MWIARDKDNRIALWHNKPYRSLTEWKSKYEGTEFPFYLTEETFSDLKWEDEPVEIELSIKEESISLKMLSTLYRDEHNDNLFTSSDEEMRVVSTEEMIQQRKEAEKLMKRNNKAFGI